MSARDIIRAIGRAFAGELSGEAQIDAIVAACDVATDDEIRAAAALLGEVSFMLRETVGHADPLEEN